MSLFTIRLEVPPIDINLRTHQLPEGASNHMLAQILISLESLKEIVMTSKDELIAQLSDVKAQVDATAAQNAKANAEISAAITANSATVAALTQQVADLQAIIAAGGADVPQEIADAVGALKVSADAAKASSQALDDLNPDPV